MSFVDVFSRKLADTSKVTSSVGVFLAMVDGLARVNLQGATVDIRCDGWSPPIPSMPVRVETVDGIMRVVGPSQALPPRAEVTASVDGGTRAAVTVEGVDYVLPVLAPYSPLATDIVVINWMSGHILGEEAAAPNTVDPGTIGGGSASFTDFVIQPTASGKYDTTWNNWWSPPEVWASDNNKGAWVYGGRFTALTGANISKIEIYLPLITQSGAAYIGVHAYPAIPGSDPTITSLVALPVRSGWVELPAAWGNFFRDNPNAGIGVTSGAGLNKWRGVGQDGQSGWLRFSGSR